MTTVFRAYCDESGKEESSQVLVVAGLLAPTARWESFETNWKLVLAHNNARYFHASEFYNRRDEFRLGTKWDSENARESFVRELLSVLQANETRPDVALISLVWKDAYKETFPKSDIVKQSVGTPYTVACTGCWWLGGKWAEEHLKSEKIAFVFDEGNEHARDALSAYVKAKSYQPFEERYKLGGVTFGDDQDLIALQAADLLGIRGHEEPQGTSLSV